MARRGLNGDPRLAAERGKQIAREIDIRETPEALDELADHCERGRLRSARPLQERLDRPRRLADPDIAERVGRQRVGQGGRERGQGREHAGVLGGAGGIEGGADLELEPVVAGDQRCRHARARARIDHRGEGSERGARRGDQPPYAALRDVQVGQAVLGEGAPSSARAGVVRQ
jgi:hypothetical protein